MNPVTGSKENVVARAIHAEIEISDDDSGTESEPKGSTPPDTDKQVAELRPKELMAQVAQAQTQMYHALMRVMESQAKVQKQGTCEQTKTVLRAR